MSEDMSTADKILWLIENEGTELAEGYEGLQRFFNYCCGEDNATKILDLIEDDVDYQYIETKTELEEQDQYDWRDGTANVMANDIWHDLFLRGLLHAPSPAAKKEMIDKWTSKIKEKLRL